MIPPPTIFSERRAVPADHSVVGRADGHYVRQLDANRSAIGYRSTSKANSQCEHRAEIFIFAFRRPVSAAHHKGSPPFQGPPNRESLGTASP